MPRKRNYDMTIPEFAAWVGEEVGIIEEALSKGYLVPCMKKGERAVRFNTLALSYKHHAGDTKHLKRWTGRHGKPVKTINGISINKVAHGGTHLFVCYLPDGRAFSFGERPLAEGFASGYAGEWVRRQTGNIIGAGVNVCLTGDEIGELLLCLPDTGGNALLRRKLRDAFALSVDKRRELAARPHGKVGRPAGTPAEHSRILADDRAGSLCSVQSA